MIQDCNLKCSYCYNVWKCEKPYPAGRLDTKGMKGLIERIVEQTGCRILTLTGGEPYLRDDIVELMRHVKKQGVSLNVITNGTLLDEDLIRKSIEAGVTLFEIQLPATERDVVRGLMGRDVYDTIVEGISKIKRHDGLVVVAFFIARKVDQRRVACLHCGEPIRPGAVVCVHCTREQRQAAVTADP